MKVHVWARLEAERLRPCLGFVAPERARDESFVSPVTGIFRSLLFEENFEVKKL
jgi:hypothetical protein